jgi:hypothetical protein
MTDTNITFVLDDENGINNNESDIHDILKQMNNLEDFDDFGEFGDFGDFGDLEDIELEDLKIPEIINYTENYTVKELLLICEYYGIAKELKAKKCNKEIIIEFLVDFESKTANAEIVCKRKNMWFYMNELKSDKFMKKYIFW